MNRPLIFLLLIAAILVASSSAFAQQPPPTEWPGFAVSPIEQDLSVNAGETLRRGIDLLTRKTNEPTGFEIQVMDLGQAETGDVTIVERDQGARSCADWITIADSVEVPPDRRLTVPYSVQVPTTAHGEYHAFVTIRLRPRRLERRIVMGVIPVATVRIAVSVRDRPTKLGMEVSGLQLQPAQGGQPAGVTVEVTNTGELRTPLAGDVLFRGPTGTFPVRVPLPHRSSGGPMEIYPGAIVGIICPLPNPFPPGHYLAQVRGTLLGNRRMQADFELEIPEEQVRTVIGKFLSAAAFKVNLEVEPITVDLNLPPGARRTVVIRIRNNGEEPVEVALEPALVRIEPDGLMTYASRWPADTPQWVEVPSASFTLAAGRSRAFHAQVVIPRDRPIGGTVACAVLIKAHTLAPHTEEEGASIGEYPVLIIARDPQAPPAKLESQGLELVRASPESNPTAAVVQVKNVGGQLGDITGQMWLEGPQGIEMSRLEIGERSREQILPGGIREFRLPLPPLDKGEHTVFAKLNPGRQGEGTLEMQESFTVTIGVPEGLKDSGSESTASGAALTEE